MKYTKTNNSKRSFYLALLGLGVSFSLLGANLTAQDSGAVKTPEAQKPVQQQGKPEEAKPTSTKDDEPFPTMEEVLKQATGSKVDPQERIRELFGEVETNLRQIDVLLSSAAAGDTQRLQEVADSGIAKLLDNSLKRGRVAQQQIQEIIKLAKQAGDKAGQSGSSSSEKSESGEGESSGSGEGSPLNRGQQQQSAEQTPEMGGEKPGSEGQGEHQGEKPGQKPEGQEPGGEEPGEKPGQTDPKDGGESGEDGKNSSGAEQDGGAAGAARRAAQAKDGWGDLPAHVKDTFRSQGRSELPVRYRDWIDEYYRKLNRRGNQ